MAVLLAKKFTSFFIQNDVIKEEDKDTYEYCFQVLILNILNFGSVLLLAAIMVKIPQTLCYLAGFFLIRKQAGEYHAVTPFKCYILSVLNYLLFLLLLVFIPITWGYQISLIISIASFFIIWCFAPIEDKNKPFCIGEYKRYQRNSRMIISILLVINSLAICLLNSSIHVYMLSLSLGSLFAAVSLVSAKIQTDKVNTCF